MLCTKVRNLQYNASSSSPLYINNAASYPVPHVHSVNTPVFAGVVTVCGGVVVIVCLIWFGICYGHYRSERDFCQFKKVTQKLETDFPTCV